VKVKNTLYEPLNWQLQPNEKGIAINLDAAIYGLSELIIVPIDEAERRIMADYDVPGNDTDTVVFYAAWGDGEWQPRSTYSDYETAKKAVDSWFFGYTNELIERLPEIDADDVFALENLSAKSEPVESKFASLLHGLAKRGFALRNAHNYEITEAGRHWLARNVVQSFDKLSSQE